MKRALQRRNTERSPRGFVRVSEYTRSPSKILNSIVAFTPLRQVLWSPMSAAAPFLALVWSPPAAIAHKPDAIARMDRSYVRSDRHSASTRQAILGVNALDWVVIAFAPLRINDPAWVRRQAAAIAALRARCGAMTDEAANRPATVLAAASSPFASDAAMHRWRRWTPSMKRGDRAPMAGGNVCGAHGARPGRRLIDVADSTLDIALGLAAKGHRVFPLNINDKLPRWQATGKRWRRAIRPEYASFGPARCSATQSTTTSASRSSAMRLSWMLTCATVSAARSYLPCGRRSTTRCRRHMRSEAGAAAGI